ncbi:beta strand repeat-containing protein [Singulisphaera sp. PoT]|uniref:beta strand repeat-containing protein n=1 Tax=Singulisphaera sp. PoT TaxID=3411797 RepID=UPI003BF5BCFC
MLNRMHRASQSIIDRLSKSSRRRHVKRREDWLHRLSMEYLEERVVLSNISWINPQGGDWDVASNWSAGRVPNAQDAVTIATANLSITHSSGANDSVQSLTSASPITLSGGSLQLAAASSINGALNVSGGSLVAKGSLNVQSIALSSGSLTSGATMTVGQFAWSGGSVSGTGQINATGFKTATSNLSLSNAAMTLSSTGLALAGDASLPLVGNAHLSGSIANATTYSLTAQVPTITIGGLAFTSDTVTLANGALSLSGTTSLPVVGSATLSGTITDASHYSLSAQVPSLKLGGYSLTGDTVTFANGAFSVKGTATLPIIGSSTLAGTFKDQWNYSLSAQLPSLTVAGFTFANDTVTYTKGILSLSGSATLPTIGSTPLSGTINDIWNYTLSGQAPSLKIGGATFTNDTITLSKGILSVSGTATVPVVGPTTLSGNITDASHYSLSAQVPSLKLGGYSLTGDTVTFANGAFSVKGTATLPIIGSSTLAGTFKDQWNYSLSAQLPSVKVGGFTLTNDTVTYAKGILSVSGTATLPVVGSVPLSGTINDAWTYSLAAQVPSISLGGFALSNDTLTLSKGVVTLSGTATLPVIGSATLSGSITDGTHYSLSAPVASLTLGAYALTNDTITLANGALSIKGTAALPVIGSVPLSGTYKDQWNYSLSAQLPTLTVAGFSSTNDTVTYAKGVLSLSGAVTLPLVGSVPLSGTIKDTWNYSLTAPLPTLTVAGYSFSNNTVTLSKGVVTLSGTATLPVIGTLPLSGTITDATHFSLSATPGDLKLGAFTISGPTVTLTEAGAVATLSLAGKAKLAAFGSASLVGTVDSSGTFTLTAPLPSVSLLGGLVTFSSMSAIMTASAAGVSVGIGGTGTVANIGTVNFKGTVNDEANYSLTGQAKLSIAGFTIDTANFTLGTQALGVAFTLPVPDIGDVGFTGSYGPGGQWSLGATYPGPVQVGPVTLTDLGFVLASDSLTLQATGTIADLQALANVKVTAQIFYDGRFMMTADAHVVQVGPFSLGEAIVKIGDDYPDKHFEIDVHAVAGFPNLGAGMTLDGVIISSTNYHFTGTDKLNIAGLSITSVQATLDSTTGFTFKGSWNYGILTATVSGTIGGDGHAHFEGNATAGALLGGFQTSTFSVIVDANPAAKTYSIDASTTLDVAIAKLNLTAHSSLGSSGWDPLVFTATASIGGALSSILSGTALFTIEPNDIGFQGSLSAPNGLGNFNVNGKVFADGTFQVGGFLGSAGQILAADAAKLLNQLGASASQIAGALKSAYNSADQDVASILHQLKVDLNTIADALQTIYQDDLSSLAKALWNHATTDVYGLIDTLNPRANGVAQLLLVLWNDAKVTADLGTLFDEVWLSSAGSVGVGGLVGGFIGAGFVASNSFEVAKFLLNTAHVGLGDTAKGISDWLGGNAPAAFWAIANGASRGLGSAVVGVVSGGLVGNSANEVARFILGKAQGSLSDAARGIADWIGGSNGQYNAFWGIAVGAGRGLGDAVAGIVGAGIVANSSYEVAKFILGTAQGSLGDAAQGISDWLGGGSNGEYYAFWGIANGAGKGLASAIVGSISANFVKNDTYEVAKFILNIAKGSLSDAAKGISDWIGGTSGQYYAFWAIATGAGKGLGNAIAGFVGAGLLNNNSFDVAKFVLNTAQASLTDTARGISDWLGGNPAAAFWAIANGAGKGIGNAIAGVVGAGFVANDSFKVAQFILNTANGTLADTAKGISDWLGGNRTAAFWAIANGAGRGLGSAVTGLVNAGLVANSSFEVAKFILNTANGTLADAAKGVSDWLGGNRTAAFWAIANGAGRSYVDATWGLINSGLLGNSYSSVSGYLFSILSYGDAVAVLNSIF